MEEIKQTAGEQFQNNNQNTVDIEEVKKYVVRIGDYIRMKNGGVTIDVSDEFEQLIKDYNNLVNLLF